MLYICSLKEKQMLKVENISVSYDGESVLEAFSCHVQRGDFACVTGRSGCGKSSLLKALVGMAPIGSGMISVDGAALNEKSCHIVREKVSYLPQDLQFPYDYVKDFIDVMMRVGKVDDRTKVQSLLQDNMTFLGLDEELLSRRMTELSGGQRQRLVLAVLALLDKEVWLLDEPTAALDAESRNLVIEFLLRLQREGKTIVAVSHDACFASHCSKVIRID